MAQFADALVPRWSQSAGTTLETAHPESRSAKRPLLRSGLALVAAALIVGTYLAATRSSAIARLEHLLAIPGDVTPALLRLDPAWAPLRDDPRFQRLVSTSP